MAREDADLAVEGGRIVAVLPAAQGLPAGWEAVAEADHRGRLLLPGFIDTHVHCPQLEVIASYGTELLDWLQRYTFPAERAFADPARSRAGAEVFLDALLASGTTAAVVFPTVHKVSAEALFDSAAARARRNAKAVVGLQGYLLLDEHGRIVALCDFAGQHHALF